MTEGLDSRRFGNLPTFLSTFIGREREITKVKQLILANRLVTLTGAGGSGKTRLALKVAHELMGDFNSSIWFIDLGSLTDSSLIPQKIVSTLNIHEKPKWSLMDSLVNRLFSQSPLLVLDNCEDVSALRACRPTAGGCRVLVTSRGPFTDPALAVVPQELEVLDRGQSVGLLRSRCPGVPLEEDGLVAVSEELGDLPLALDLAGRFLYE